jgi:hypothetical protein
MTQGNGTMDSNEPTAWEEINPTTALAARRELPCEYLAPASNTQFRDELTACLILVAPVGMTEEAKAEWLAIAWRTLNHLPADLLAAGCIEARKTADHPSKIVPAILSYADERFTRRSRNFSEYPAALPAPCRKSVMDRRGQPMSEADTAELNSILESLGATARYRSDGSRYSTETGG